jgi:hypothetical protein
MITSHRFLPGDYVIDLTAKENGWDDVNGVVLSVDGPHVKVMYVSGNVRSKLAVNLRRQD